MARSATLKLVTPTTPLAFGTKAETLKQLETKLRTARVLPQETFLASEWKKSSARVVERILASGWLNGTGVVVRSSARGEDSATQSFAGHYDSVLGVRDENALRSAVTQVLASYGASTPDEQVLVQPMLENVALSGVAFGVDPSSGSPYYVINFDSTSGSTSSVTDGSTNALRTFYCCHAHTGYVPRPLVPVLELMRELHQLFGTDRLDVEFAVDRSGVAYLFQCRPLVAASTETVPAPTLYRTLEEIQEKAQVLNKPNPYLLGTETVFGIMPDWNPAEIIGVRPKPLAISMYRELITDSTWAYQRDNYGYRNLRSFPLLVSFAGLPYIDVRLSFNSFIPRDLSAPLGEKLVNYYIQRLAANPTLHDKVEFEVVYTCYTLDLRQRLEALLTAGFDQTECEHLAEHLRTLTNGIINPKTGLWKKDIQKISILEKRLPTIRESSLDTTSKIYWLFEDAKRYGTLPFAGLARAGFIAVQMLRSLVNVGVLSSSDYERFMSSLETVSTRMGRDFRELSREAFLARYGHLRPGTYDILSPRYDEDPDRYFDWSDRQRTFGHKAEPFSLSLEQLKRVESLLKEHALENDVIGFFDFIRAAIEGREFAKFVFTRSVSDGLSLIKSLAEQHNLSPDDIAYADFATIRSLYATSCDQGETLKSSIERGRAAHQITKALILPPLIQKPSDVWAFEVPSSSPNFITQKSVKGPVVLAQADRETFRGAILFITSADPGYDWIFSHGIGGLVTMFGGVNSHMAIRAGELGIPAVIGSGEKLYHQWSRRSVIEIDCLNRQVREIQ